MARLKEGRVRQREANLIGLITQHYLPSLALLIRYQVVLMVVVGIWVVIDHIPIWGCPHPVGSFHMCVPIHVHTLNTTLLMFNILTCISVRHILNDYNDFPDLR